MRKKQCSANVLLLSGVVFLLIHLSTTIANNVVEGGNSGFLDVTKEPFNIDNTGKTDVTIELQKAITYARLNFMVVYLRLGTYLISDTLVLLSLIHI